MDMTNAHKQCQSQLSPESGRDTLTTNLSGGRRDVPILYWMNGQTRLSAARTTVGARLPPHNSDASALHDELILCVVVKKGWTAHTYTAASATG